MATEYVKVAAIPYTKRHVKFNQEIQHVLKELAIPHKIEESVSDQEGDLVYMTTSANYKKVGKIIESLSNRTPVETVIKEYKV